MVVCKLCGVDFPNVKSLGHHRKAAHPNDGFPCSSCDAVFKNRQARHRHVCPNSRKDIGSSDPSELPDINCGFCGVFFSSMESLCAHLKETHSQPASVQCLSFASQDDYVQWKEKVESDGRFNFQQRNKRKDKTATTLYLRCHRSGCTESISEGKRAPKKTGSIKVGYSCSSFAVVKIFDDSHVTVKCCLDHCLHESRLVNMHIPNDMKKWVAQFYTEGRSVSWIVDKLRNGHSISNRAYIITRKEVYNIVSLLGIRKEQFSENDALSVELLVEHHNSEAAKAGGLPPFFCYQRQDLHDGVFTLGIQTAFQLEIMQQFGKRAICVDATHGTQRYKFLLVTLLVVDDFGKGFPAAWFITSNENLECLTRFFAALKERTGRLSCDVFMSDDAPQYFNAWKSVFCDQDIVVPTQKLLCVWHVMRNWRKQLLSKVSKENVAMVWSMLTVVLREQDQAKFYGLVAKLMTELNECEPEFAVYFHKEYLSNDHRIREWAYWARKGSIVNVNMYLEAFHRTLKKKFLNRNEGHRLDLLLARLLEAATWYLQEYLVAVERDGHENSYRLKETHDRHRKSTAFQPEDVFVVGARHWKIKASSKEQDYDVIRIKDRCQCRMRCQYCSVCPDLFDCSCPSALFGSVACKHVHFIFSNFDQSSQSQAGSFTLEPAIIDSQPEPAIIDPTRLRQYLETPNAGSIEDRKRKLRQLLMSAFEKVDAVDNDHEISECIRKASALDAYLGICSRRTLPDQSMSAPKMAPNKKMTCQPRFFQVRRKRKRVDECLGRPDAATTSAIRENFDEMETEVCAACFLDTPLGQEENDEEVEWITCDVCDNWYHNRCVTMGVSANFICNRCA